MAIASPYIIKNASDTLAGRVEFKFSEAPKITKSMHIAINDLSWDELWVPIRPKEFEERIFMQGKPFRC